MAQGSPCVRPPLACTFLHAFICLGGVFLSKIKEKRRFSPIQESVKTLLNLGKTSNLHFPLSHFPWPGSLAVAPALSHAGSGRDSPGTAAGTELVPERVPLHQMCCRGALGVTQRFRGGIAATRELLLRFLLAVSIPPLRPHHSPSDRTPCFSWIGHYSG